MRITYCYTLTGYLFHAAPGAGGYGAASRDGIWEPTGQRGTIWLNETLRDGTAVWTEVTA